MTLYYDENTYIKFGISGERAYVMEYIDDQYTRVTEGPAGTAGGSVGLRVETRGLVREFYLNDTLFAALDQVTCLCSEGLKKGKRFTGAMTGVYNNGKNLICWRQHSRI